MGGGGRKKSEREAGILAESLKKISQFHTQTHEKKKETYFVFS